MASPEEIGHIDTKCDICHTELPAQVLKSGAGYYIGTFCPKDGPYSRESGYYGSREEATKSLEAKTFGRSTAFLG